MSTFDDASLVFIPSGYKTSKAYSVKPIDGTGDLTFTRSNDTATRVNSAGLIEKVRTNLVLQSNSFNTTWTASNASVTSGQAGYDGTNNAWLLSKSAANGYISQGPASSGNETISVYAKAGTDNWLHILVRDSASVFFGGYWDLQNGVVGSAIGATTLRIESVGNGWYRCSASFVKSTSNYYRIYPAEGNNDTSGTSGNILIQNAQLEAGDIATQPILTTTAAVSVGPVANVPRLDYLNSSCPRLLLEPQRTNLVTFSEQMDNAAWTKTGGTISANVSATVDPSGYNGADKLVGSAGAADQVLVGQSISLGSAGTYTFSFFVKAAEKTWVRLRTLGFDAGGNQQTWFNLSTGAVGTDGFGNSKIVSYGNGWYRCIVSFATTTDLIGSVYAYLADSDNTTNVTRNGTDGLYLWGSMLELGAYATSYVNSLGAAVTRGADACSKTGISSLIGQTEGTLFAEVDIDYLSTGIILAIGDGTANNRFVIQFTNATTLFCTIRIAGVNVDYSVTVPAIPANGGIFKIALGYKTNDYVFALNGVIYSPSTATRAVPACSALYVGQSTFSANQLDGGIKQTLLFKTRLSNSELAALTTL